MSRFWSGTIGGVALVEVGGDVAGFDLIGAENFEATYTGNSVLSANGHVHTQYSILNAGHVLEIKFLHVPKTLLTSLLTALKATLPSGSSVACSFTDGYQTIPGMFKPHVPLWYERGSPDGNYIKDAVIRLIYTGLIP